MVCKYVTKKTSLASYDLYESIVTWIVLYKEPSNNILNKKYPNEIVSVIDDETD